MKLAFFKKITICTLLICLLSSFTPPTVLDPVMVGSFPAPPAIDSNNEYAYVPNEDTNTVSVVDIKDPSNATVVATITGLDFPNTPVIDSNNEFIYISNFDTGIVTVYNILDPTSPVFVEDITVQNSPLSPVIDSNNAFLYVANENSNSVSKIDLSDSSVTNIAVGSQPQVPAIDSNNQFLYVSNSFDGTVTKIDLSDNSTSTIYTMGGQIVGAPLLDSNDEYLYVPGGFPNEIIRIKLSDNSNVKIPFGSSPKTPAIDTSNSYLYVSDTGNTVSVIRLSDNMIVETLTVGGATSNPRTPVFDATNQLLFVTTFNEDFLWTYDVSNPENVEVFSLNPTTPGAREPVIDSSNAFIYVSAGSASGFLNIFSLSGSEPSASLAPPTNLQGMRAKDRFGFQTDYINHIMWLPSTSPTVTYYSVYRNGRFIGCTSSAAPFFNDHNRQPGQTYTYTVISGSENGFSEPATLVF